MPSKSAVRAIILFSALAIIASAQQKSLPRTADGKPDLQGIWQVQGHPDTDLAAGAVEGGKIPYQPQAAQKKQQNFAARKTADPVGHCYLPGVPRIMYMQFPLQIFQTPEHVAITFEWSQVHRLIYTDGKPPLHGGNESWMGDSRGRWEGDTLVVEVRDHNGKTWFDMAGNFHSDALRVTERYTLTDPDTIDYRATIEDPKTFSKPWTIHTPLHRRKDMARLLEHQCQDLVEEANGDFERDNHTWYPPADPATAIQKTPPASPPATLPVVKTGANLKRTADGKPDLTGYYNADAGTANQGIEKHEKIEFTPATRGIVVDPADKLLPYQTWARAERNERQKPYRGYDDPTAHCFPAGVPRSMYVPSPLQILQTPGYVVILHERMSWRIIPLSARAGEGPKHLPDNIRLWQGDSIGHWEGDVLVVETTNLNGKTWLNEFGDMVSHAERVVEHFIPTGPNKILYRATVTDPVVYTRPWTIEFALDRQAEQLLEVACHEDDEDLAHLKDIRDEYRAKLKKGK